MSGHEKKYNAADLLDRLDDKGLVPDRERLSGFLTGLVLQKKPHVALYFPVYAGACLVSCFLLVFLLVSGIMIGNREVLLVRGGILMAVAGGLWCFSGSQNMVRYWFFLMFSFAMMLVGTGFFVSGIIDISHAVDRFLQWPETERDGLIVTEWNEWSVTGAFLVATGIIYCIYRVFMARFLFLYFLLYSITVNILYGRDLPVSRELLFNGFFGLLLACAVLVTVYGRIRQRDCMPLFAACILLLSDGVFLLASNAGPAYTLYAPFMGILPFTVDLPGVVPAGPVFTGFAFVNLLLTAGLVVLFVHVAGGVKKPVAVPLMLACAGAVLAGLVSAPGILLSAGMMVLGHAAREKLLVVAGVVSLPVFLWVYYYNLDISLLQKSGVLIASGVILLAGRFYIIYRGWNREDI